MLKMMAIFMRFTVSIPIIIMGETGVGKTRLVNFMCALMRRGKDVENFFILKTQKKKERIINNKEYMFFSSKLFQLIVKRKGL